MTKPYTPEQKTRRKALRAAKRRLRAALALAVADRKTFKKRLGGWLQRREFAITTSKRELKAAEKELARMKPGRLDHRAPEQPPLLAVASQPNPTSDRRP